MAKRRDARAHCPVPNGKQAKAKLFCCLDNKSRLVCYAAWYGSETAVSYLDCLWNAFRLRGLPKNIYFDNGSSFRDARLKLGCASVGVNLVWARPYKPQGKGAIERWNRSVRDHSSACADEGTSRLTS
jgi:transposase InsO family protein